MIFVYLILITGARFVGCSVHHYTNDMFQVLFTSAASFVFGAIAVAIAYREGALKK